MKRQKGPSLVHLYEETYGENIYVLWPAGRDEIIQFVQQELQASVDCEGDFQGACVEVTTGRKTGIVIGLKTRPRDAWSRATLAHEVFHAVEAILARSGIRHSKSTSEAWAYLVGALFRRISEAIEKKSRRKIGRMRHFGRKV